MTQWFYEEQTEYTRIGVRVREMVYQTKSRFQDIKVFDTIEYGLLLALDDVIQLTELDEFVYHEMLAHVPLHAHSDPQDVLVVGGGDGGMVREVSKHDSVRRVVLAEIDEAVVQTSLNYLPSVSCALHDNPKLEIRIGDAIELVANSEEEYDLIIVDSSDPVGPAVGLFSKEFYLSIEHALKPGGMVVVQGESPWLNRSLVKRMMGDLASIFPYTGIYWGNIPTYPGGTMVFPAGSKGNDVAIPLRECIPGLRCYSPEVHRAAFALPLYLQPSQM